MVEPVAPLVPPADPVTGRRRRPFALLVLVGIMLFKAVLIVLVSVSTFALPDSPVLRVFHVPAVAQAAEGSSLVALAVFVVGLLLLLSGIGILLGRRTGWLLAMVLTGVFVLFDIIGFIEGTANYVWMALNIVTVFYLNQREVRESVGAVGPAMGDDDLRGERHPVVA
jgi:hypothetical protein